jgi:hypothetical protein
MTTANKHDKQGTQHSNPNTANCHNTPTTKAIGQGTCNWKKRQTDNKSAVELTARAFGTGWG